jgi:DNA polymerase zeta
MPCVDIADSIVQTARQTLENAINLIHGTKQWKAKVVYGDTGEKRKERERSYMHSPFD